MICRGETKVFYAETTYPPAPIAEHDLMPYKHRVYADLGGGSLCRDVAAHRCYEETI
jgi:hypothetical protein